MAKILKTHHIVTSLRRGGYKIADLSVTAAAWPHFMLYERETRAPLMTIFDASNDAEISQVVEQWFQAKAKEASYAQIATAVVFTSVITTFSWNGLQSSHRFVSASWYLSILFPLFSAILGAQQSGFDQSTWPARGQLPLIVAEALSSGQLRRPDVTAAAVDAGAGVAGAGDISELLGGFVFGGVDSTCNYAGGEEGRLRS